MKVTLSNGTIIEGTNLELGPVIKTVCAGKITSKTTPVTSIGWRAWDRHEKTTAKNMDKQGKSFDEIAGKINRTPGAVRFFLSKNRHRPGNYNHKKCTAKRPNANSPWTDNDLTSLRLMNKSGKTHSEIANILGRSRKAIVARLCRK